MAIKTLNISRTQFTVGDFVSWMRNGELDLSPSFQRRPVWKKSAKSYLIDTIVRGLPTPIIFLRQITDTKKLTTKAEMWTANSVFGRCFPSSTGSCSRISTRTREDFTVTETHNEDIAGRLRASRS